MDLKGRPFYKADQVLHFIMNLKCDLPYLMMAFHKSIVESRKIPYCQPDECKEQLKYIYRWFKQDKRCSLLLYGNVGSGKTTMLRMMEEIFKYLIPKDALSITFATADEAFEAYLRREGDFINSICEKDILLLDDLGAEPVKCMKDCMERYPMIYLLSERYDKGLITIVSTNLNQEEITKRYGVRIWDRICENYGRLSFRNGTYRTMIDTIFSGEGGEKTGEGEQ